MSTANKLAAFVLLLTGCSSGPIHLGPGVVRRIEPNNGVVLELRSGELKALLPPCLTSGFPVWKDLEFRDLTYVQRRAEYGDACVEYQGVQR